MKRRHLIAFGASVATMGLPTLCFSQTKFPQRPVTLVVPTPPGGSTDFTARLIAEPLTRALGQSVIVDNKPGASGNIGNQFVARSKSDGYTLLMAYSGYQVGNPHLFKDAGWDPIKDFTPVAMVTRAPQVVAIHHALPVNTLQELIAYAKKNPGKLNYASSGNGSIQHIAGELFKQLTGTFITHIPYRGSGPAVQDLLAGTVDMHITTPASVVAHIKSGRLRALAVTSPKRLTSCLMCPQPVKPASKATILILGLRCTRLRAHPLRWFSKSTQRSTKFCKTQRYVKKRKTQVLRWKHSHPHSWVSSPAKSWTTGAM